VSWPWLALVLLAVALLGVAEWPRLQRLVGADAQRVRARRRRKAQLHLVVNDETDDFEASVRRDLDSLPTIEEPRTGPKRRAP
jgi:hypothetical protein